MPNLRPLALALLLSGLYSSASFSSQAPMPITANHGLGTAALHTSSEKQSVRILASLPVTYGLGEILLKDSGVELQRAADANLPGSRQSAYFSGRGAPALQKLANQADAVIGLRSLWPDDPLYIMARRSNVRIVEVDAARPVDGALPGIAVQPGQGTDGLNSQPWLSSNNPVAHGRCDRRRPYAPGACGQAEDREQPGDAQAAPAQAQRRQRNAPGQGRQPQRIQPLRALRLPGRRAQPELIHNDARSDEQWTPEALAKLSETLKDADVKLVLDHRQPPEAVKAAIAQAGSTLLVLETESVDPLTGLEASITQVLDILAPT